MFSQRYQQRSKLGCGSPSKPLQHSTMQRCSQCRALKTILPQAPAPPWPQL